MTGVRSSLLRRGVLAAASFLSFLSLLGTPFHDAHAQASAPIQMQEQMRMFNSLPPAQQQQLIRELQRQLPQAQRDQVIGMLQGRQEPDTGKLDTDTTDALDSALQEQRSKDGETKQADSRFKPRESVVLQFMQREPAAGTTRPVHDKQELDAFQNRLEKGNPYELDQYGRITLPGIPPIRLGGLSVDEATVRVQTQAELRQFEIIVTRLPLEPAATGALEPFGYDLFRRPRSAFSPATDLPVPADYVIGPGDTIVVTLFGNASGESYLEVNRDGTINIRELGPINVAGLSFLEMRNVLTQRVTEQLIGTRVSVTLGELRSLRVFVLGDVERPGSYSVSALSTVTNALFAGGGVKTIGSLRNIAVKRDNVTVSTLDLYDLLLRGDTRGDVRLKPGDAILVQPLGATVVVSGEVRRPAIYEIKGERTIGELIALAGGLTANANRSTVKLERVVANRGTTVEDIDIAGAEAQTPIRDGDVVRVQRNLEQLESSVRLEGNVFQPGIFHWFRGMRLTDVLSSPELVKPMSDLGYVLVRREASPNVATAVVSADLREAWARPNGPSNVALEARDTIYVFNLDNGRTQYLEPILTQLGAQALTNAPVPIVRIDGEVKSPHEYPLEAGMRVTDLVRAGGGLKDAAYGTSAELTRYAVVNGEYRQTELVVVDLAAIARGDVAANLVLRPYDHLSVKEISRWTGEGTVMIRGEVTFPGSYPIRRGETLRSVLIRAGGLTDLAFPEGSVFTRVELRELQHEQLEVLASRVERDLAAISVSEPNASTTIQTGQSLISQLRNTVATGRLVIHLGDIVAGVQDVDVTLKDGDQLVVPDRQQEVTVLGEVQYATSHLYERGLNRDEYIAKSGGLSTRADRKRIYVVRANGEVVADSGSRWFRRGSETGIRPGDAIVVPLDVDQPIARWSAITQIIYNLALGAAAVASF